MSVVGGPDDEQVVEFDECIRRGFNGLAILDLTDAGKQPMRLMKGRGVVMLNREVYNHLESRTHLNHSVSRGYSDTETLTEFISVLGFESGIGLLDGMFAVSAWECERSRLYLARGRAGIEPLFLGRRDRYFVFAR